METKDESQQPVEQLIANRRGKLDALREMGQDPYPRRYRVERSVSEARSLYEGLSAEELEKDPPVVRLGGRLRAVRGHGKVSFADLSDGAGQIQLYLKKNDLDESSWQVFKLLDLGDFLGVEGPVFRTRAGELSVAVKELTVLSKALRPLPEKYHGLADREARARQRYLDLLSNPESREVFEIRSKAISSIRRRLEAAGFIEVETPMMQPMPGGATARPFVTHHNTLDLDLYLRIAPELFLKRLISDRLHIIERSLHGLANVIQVGRYFRQTDEAVGPGRMLSQ